ncbi:MAG: DUF1059 domain-containing protein [Nitrosopumilaceae archaeon]|nr:DUF1059 domain-containing protein [Nitrosopumilaceae archaeon]
MAKSLSCVDVGATECNWSASADTEEELMVKVREHAKEHGHEVIPADLAVKIKAAIKDL